MQSVPALLVLLERAVHVLTEANRNTAEARNVAYVHTLLAALMLDEGADEAPDRVRLLVKEELLALTAAMRKRLTAMHSVPRRRQPFVPLPASAPATA